MVVVLDLLLQYVQTTDQDLWCSLCTK